MAFNVRQNSRFQFLYSSCRFDIVCFMIQLCSLKYSTFNFTQFNSTTKLNRETNNVKSTFGLENWILECSIADIGTNYKTTTSNAKNTSKIEKLNLGGH